MHAQAGRRFRVVVADARLQLEGRQLLSRLLRAGIPCTYVLLNALSYIITVRLHPPACTRLCSVPPSSLCTSRLASLLPLCVSSSKHSLIT